MHHFTWTDYDGYCVGNRKVHQTDTFPAKPTDRLFNHSGALSSTAQRHRYQKLQFPLGPSLTPGSITTPPSNFAPKAGPHWKRRQHFENQNCHRQALSNLIKRAARWSPLPPLHCTFQLSSQPCQRQTFTRLTVCPPEAQPVLSLPGPPS
jgi:hypothetical protein